MPDKPRISFVVPVYKPKIDLFEKCIKALLDQSIDSWEAVFVLDGPCDEARRVINRMMSGRKNFAILEIEHGGACRARNAGAEMAKGDIICFWDCDCIIECHVAKMWLDIFDKHQDIGFVYSGYRFLNENGAINSEPWDPWLLRVRNFISTCFPVRKKLAAKWNENLKSLQDWDFWLSVSEKGAKGRFVPGFAFSTAYPDPESISGKGCTSEAWLERMDKVRDLHNIPKRNVCVSSLSHKYEGIRLAKMINADYMDIPNDKPNYYTTIIQLGFSLGPRLVEAHSGIFRDPKVKKIVYWTNDDIMELYNSVSLRALERYSILLNATATQFVEDKAAKDIMERAGFKVEISPVPQEVAEVKPLPKKPKFAVDIQAEYGPIFASLEKSIPDIELEVLTGAHKIEDYTGLIHFYSTKSMGTEVKRMILNGRAVISNIQQPYCGFVDDATTTDLFIPAMVEKIRAVAYGREPITGLEYYKGLKSKERLMEVIA